jgi:outer membrane protein OmpA-like peptidoglycan-associated protein
MSRVQILAGFVAMTMVASIVVQKGASAGEPEVVKAGAIEAALMPTLNTRGIAIETPNAPPESLTVDLPGVTFEFNSFRLTPLAERQLHEVGMALSKPGFRQSRFLIAGHTDGVGSSDYNQALSEKRARTAVDYLQNNFDLSAVKLSAVGWGKSRLLADMAPDAASQRRVEIVNLGVR